MRTMAALVLLTFAAAAYAGPLAPAHADLKTMDPSLRASVRYLDMENLAPADRIKAYQACAGHIQHLSRATAITPPTVVNGTLLRINLDDYAIDHAIWEKLADADPWYHVKTTAVYQKWWGQSWQGSRYYPSGYYRTAKEVTALAWLADTPDEYAQLCEVVGWTRSSAPILRADWWFNQTAAQQNRSPGYYDFLGIRDKATFEALGGFDAKKKRRKTELREAVAKSGVTLQPRALARFDADEGGAYWYSIDFKLARDERNPLRVLGSDVERKPDGFEGFARLPNGFWATGAFDGKGKAAPVAPGDLATDHKSKSNDKQVHANISCIRCHDNAGLKDIDGWVRNLFQPPLVLTTPDYNEARRLKEQYLRDLQRFIDRDRAIFSEAVKEATGLDAKEYAAVYSWFWERYEDGEMDAEQAAKSLGVTPLQLKAALLKSLESPAYTVEAVEVHAGVYAVKSYAGQPITYAPGADAVLSSFLLDAARRRPIPIRQWEEAAPLAQYLLRARP